MFSVFLGVTMIPFNQISSILLSRSCSLVEQWAPGGHYRGAEYITRNPTRADKNPGSFKINTATGEWADFATSDRGRDLISLYAYLNGISNGDAARELSLNL